MEPIPVFYDEAARSAVAIKPKQPFLDWTNALTPDFPQTEAQGTVYLVKMMDDNEAVEKWLKKNYKKIFENELNGQSTGEEDWPTKRDWKLFNEWFDYSVHPFVVDILEGPVKKY